MSRLLLIVNPIAGKSTLKTHLMDVIDTFVKHGYEVTVYTTQGKRDLSRVIAERGQAYDMIVCSGGDGSINEAVNTIIAEHMHKPLGYIPCGTVNDFATNYGIPKLPKEAAEHIMNGRATPSDVGVLEGHYFVYVAAFGVFTDVSYQTPQQMKNNLGRVAYLIEGIKGLVNIKPYPMRVRYNDVEIEDKFIYGMMSNSSSIGGFQLGINRDMCLNDGLMEVTLIREPRSLAESNAVIGALLTQTADNKLILHAQTSHMEIESEIPVPWTLDGEAGGAYTKMTIDCIKDGYEIILGDEPKKMISAPSHDSGVK